MLIYSTNSLQYTPRNNLNCPFVTILRRYHCFKNTARHSFRIHEDPFENRRYPETIDSATTIITVHHHNNREGMWSRTSDHMVCVGEKEGMKTSRHEADTASDRLLLRMGAHFGDKSLPFAASPAIHHDSCSIEGPPCYADWASIPHSK